MKWIILITLTMTSLWAQDASIAVVPAAASTDVTATPVVETKPGIWIVNEFNLHDLAWPDLGLEHERSFSAPLVDSWQKWLRENSSVNKEIKSCSDECLSTYSEWQDQDAFLLTGAIAEPYRNGVWVKISIDLARPKPGGKFRWQGRVVLIDINSKQILSSSELLPEEKEWSGLSQKKVNSALATRIYRSALPALKSLKLAQSHPYTRATRLKIQGGRHLADIMKVLELLKVRGESLGLALQLEYVQQQEARVLCFYRGEEKSFTDLLSQLKELKSSDSYELVHHSTGVEHVLKMVTH